MTLRQYIITMVLGTILAIISWIFVIISFDPLFAGPVGFWLFYLAAFTVTTGVLSIFGLLVRASIMKRKTLISKQVAIAFRQSVLLSFLLIGALILQSKNILNWWNSGMLVAALTILEFFIISLRRKV